MAPHIIVTRAGRIIGPFPSYDDALEWGKTTLGAADLWLWSVRSLLDPAAIADQVDVFAASGRI